MKEPVHQTLQKVELQLEALAAALLQHDESSLTSAATGLRDAMAALQSHLASAPAALTADEGLRTRLLRANQKLADCRDNMARRAAGVDRALASLLPAQNLPTYAGAAGPAALAGKRFGSRFS